MFPEHADGCTGLCVHNPSQNTHDELATIARQTGGRGLFAAFDGTHFGTGGDDHGPMCTGTTDEGVDGDPECNDQDDDD